MLFLISLIVILSSLLIYWQIQDNKLLKTVTEKNRGTWSERDLVLRLLKKGIPAENIFHDAYIKKKDGRFSQIDIAVVTEVGVVVIEVKNYSGWLFGVGNNSQWTQLLSYGKKRYSFYNPIFQNDGHIKSLKNHLVNFGEIPFYSVIVFYGNCELKKFSFVPRNIFIVKSRDALDAVSNILENNLQLDFDKTAICQLLSESVKNGSDREIRIQHAQNISNILWEKNTQKIYL